MTKKSPTKKRVEVDQKDPETKRSLIINILVNQQ